MTLRVLMHKETGELFVLRAYEFISWIEFAFYSDDSFSGWYAITLDNYEILGEL
jgi:hypothetical protein